MRTATQKWLEQPFFAAIVTRTAAQSLEVGLGTEICSRRFRNFFFKLSIFPIAGGVEILGGNWLPMKQLASLRALRESNPNHPGLKRENWYRRKPLWVRLFIVGAGPLASVLFGVALLPLSIWMFGTINDYSNTEPPADHRCAAACLIDFGLADESIIFGDIAFSMGEREVVYPADSLRFGQGESRRGEAVDTLAEWWSVNPGQEIEVTTEDDNNVVSKARFEMLRLVHQNKERLRLERLQYCRLHDYRRDFGEKMRTSLRNFGPLLFAERDERAFPAPWWEKTIIGHLVATGFRFWENGPTAFLWLTAYYSIITGLLNLLPILPLDGGRICQDILVSCGARGRRSRTVARYLLTIGILIVVVGSFLLPLVIDAIILLVSLVSG